MSVYKINLKKRIPSGALSLHNEQNLFASSISYIFLVIILNSKLGTFGRRASDGGANLQIYYPTTCCAPMKCLHSGNSSAGESSLVNAQSQSPYDGTGASSINEANEEIQGFVIDLLCLLNFEYNCFVSLSRLFYVQFLAQSQ